MKRARSAYVFAALAAVAGAQRIADFECQVPGAVPSLAGPADCEGLVSNGSPAGQAAIVGAPSCGMPANGARYATITANQNTGASMPPGGILGRPFAAALSELRVPLGGGVVAVALNYSFVNSEFTASGFNDGFDVSVVDAAGNRLALVARGDTFSFASGCSGLRFIRATIPPTPAGAYLSLVAFNDEDTVSDSVLLVDDVRIERNVGFECQTAGSSFGAAPDCEGVVGQTGLTGPVSVSNVPQCGFPTQGAQYARLFADGFLPAFNTGDTLARPIPTDFSEIRVAVPTGATSVAFDYAFFNAEGTNSPTYVDGFDVSLVDGAGNALQLLVKGDAGATNFQCNGVQRFVGSIPAAAPGTFVSFVVFNEEDDLGDSRLLVDDVCFAGRPRLTYFSPFGPGSLAARVDCATPGQLFYTPITLTPGNFPIGAFYGVDISVFDIFLQVSAGFPFVGALDASGSFDLPAFVGLPSGLTLYANVVVNITSATPDVGFPVSYTIP